MITFTPDQQTAILEWLLDLQSSGLTLDDIIRGIYDGTLFTTVDEVTSQPISN